MIVSVTRDDLRDEFSMADEAFALSPISARAAQPREEDYDAISEAFMETSRGRWFLGEYAKRNRNADTRMVLDAVTRIEENLAAQRQPPFDSGLAEALAAIRRAVKEARAAASAALDSLALEENLAPVRRAARVIKEISWRWREIGADGRICDLLDSQVSAIEAGCGPILSKAPRAALSAAFDLIAERIEEFGERDAAPSQAAEEATRPPSPSPALSDEMLAAAVEAVQAAGTTNDAEAAMSTSAMPAEAVVVTPEVVAVRTEVADVSVETADMPAAMLDVTPEPADENPEAADTYDEALLDMVALEMAAPDPSDTVATFDTVSDEIQVREPRPADPEIVAERPEPMVAPAQPPTIQPSDQPSLGSSLIANGMVRKPNASPADPLAPIRRMSQAEKIAFFS
jgi:hypothetical protein